MSKNQPQLIIQGFSYIKENYNTRPDQVPHLPLQVRRDAFDAPIKSQTYDKENATLTVEFERPLTAMSHYIFVAELDGKAPWYAIESITLPDTLNNALDVNKDEEGKSFRTRIDYTCPVIKGKHSIDNTFWAPDGKLLFWSANKDITSVFAQAVGIKSLPDYFGFTIEGNKLVIPEGVETLGEHCFQGYGGFAQVKLPKSLKRLPKYAFSDCRWLAKINLTHIEEIGDFVLSETVLKTVKLGKKLRFIGEGAFTRPVRLRQPIFEGGEKFVIADGRGLICDNVLVLCPPKDYPDLGTRLYEFDIPEGVIRIGDNSCRLAPTTLTFPSSLREIGNNAFGEYKMCGEVEFPESVEEIGNDLFAFNPYIKGLTVPSKVTVIPEGMVQGCNTLRIVRIMGENIKTLHHSFYTSKIDHGGVSVTPKFETLEIHSVVPPELITKKLCDSQIDFLTAASIVVPQNSVEQYKQARGWNTYSENIKAGDF